MHALLSVRDSMQEAASTVLDTVSESVEIFQRALDEKRAQLKDLLEVWVKEKIQEQAEWLIDSIPGIVKYNLEDPYMPRWVRRALFAAVDKSWPDFRQEILWELEAKLDGDEKAYEKKLDERPPPCCLRGWMRYRLFPYNKGIWYTLGDPVFILVNTLAVIPTYGICAYTFLFIFLVIDKRDEYQLIDFILSFKGAQFFSWGLVKGIVGFSLYFMCVTFPDISVDSLNLDSLDNLNMTARTTHKCEAFGPGRSDSYLTSIISWLLPLLLVWASFFLLRFSKEKGRVSLDSLEDHSTKAAAEAEKQARRRKAQAAGGYIRYLLYYDMVVFLICIALLLIIVNVQPSPESGSKWTKMYNASRSDWQVQQTLYFCQFIYGLLSIVFIPFKIPFLQAVLTHSVPTAYDENGRCCKFKGPDKPTQEEFRKGIGDQREEQQAILLDDEHDGLMSHFASIARGRTVDLDLLRRRKKSVALAAPAPEAPSAAEAAAGGTAPELV